MIRFLADTWRDAILRPVAMAAPNSSVYIEIAAPDFRFALHLFWQCWRLISTRKTKLRPPRLATDAGPFCSGIPVVHTLDAARQAMAGISCPI
jgi:hypothetical protein